MPEHGRSRGAGSDVAGPRIASNLPMLTKTVHHLSRTTAEFVNGAEPSRGLSWPELLDLLRFAVRRLREEKLPQVAGSLTFTSTLGLVPLLTIVLAIFTMFPAFGQLRTAIDAWFVQNLMPKAIASTISGNLTQFASKAKGLSALGAVVLLFTTTMTMSMIERAFNRIWSVRQPRPLAQRILVYWALITLGPVLFGVSISFTTQLFNATGGLGQDATVFGMLFFTLASVAVTTGGYTLLYMIVPHRKVSLGDAFVGGLSAAIAFEVAKRVFGLFISQFPTYAIIYGALAALPLFLVWMYVSWMITLVGAVLTAALPVVKHERWWHEPAPGSAFVDAMAILKVLYGGAQLTGTALVTSSMIRRYTRIGYDELGELLERMVAAGWVGRVLDEAPARAGWKRVRRGSDENWVLLVDPTILQLADVYRLFVFYCAQAEAMRQEDPTGPDSGLYLDSVALVHQVEDVVEHGLDQTLAEHFGAPVAEPAVG